LPPQLVPLDVGEQLAVVLIDELADAVRMRLHDPLAL